MPEFLEDTNGVCTEKEISMMKNKLSLCVAVAALLSGAVACGGGGGGGGSSDSATIQGSLRDADATARTLAPGEGGIAGVQVSALGDTAVTDENGNFSLSADGESFAGGEVQFVFNGAGIDDAVVLDGIQGGPGAVTLTAFTRENSGVISGEATDVNGNRLGSTPGARLACSQVRTFVDGANGGTLWKPHSERTGTPAILMPPEYQGASIGVFNVRGEPVDGPIIRDCCSHNGGRDHTWLSRSAGDLAGAGVPLTVRYEFPNGFVDCLTVPDPTQRYD